MRAAIGASRGRLMSQLLSEGLVLAIAGGAAGLLIAWWPGRAAGVGTDVLPVPVKFDFHRPDGPALRARRVDGDRGGVRPGAGSVLLEARARAGAQGIGRSASRRRLSMRDVLVVGQLALSLVLLVAGALLIRGPGVARAMDLGFDPAPISSLSFNLRMNGYDDERATAFARGVRTLRGLPGVAGVSTASRLPLSPDVNMDGVKVPGHHAADEDETPTDTVVGCRRRLFRRRRAHRRRPRVHRRRGDQQAPRVINETMAKQAGRTARRWAA